MFDLKARRDGWDLLNQVEYPSWNEPVLLMYCQVLYRFYTV